MFQSSAFQAFAFQSVGFGNPSPQPSITGGHFIPDHQNRKKHTLSNILTIYNKAKELPRIETKELRDAVAEFVEPAIAMQPCVPDIFKVDYEALQANEAAYEKFESALQNIQNKLKMKIEKLEAEDDELLLMAILACAIH